MPLSGNKVDEIVWDWVKSILMNPQLLSDGLDDYQAVMEQEAEPIQQRLRVVNDLLKSNEDQLERLLDLFLTGEFTREMLSDRKNRLESTISSLEQERENLIHYLEQSTFTPKQADSIRKFAADILNGISSAEKDFKARKKIVGLLNVTGTLAEEENESSVFALYFWRRSVWG